MPATNHTTECIRNEKILLAGAAKQGAQIAVPRHLCKRTDEHHCQPPTTQQSVSEMEIYKRAQIAVPRYWYKRKDEHHCQSPTTQQSVSEMERFKRAQIAVLRN